ncbi:hypothetical protein F4801DRAFT_578282 [Xylaria longipes]|nr:hypothetical protein F4801DRAFT_578282 [Xylaria longipes]
MISRIRKCWRYENGPDDNDILQQQCSSDPDNPEPIPDTISTNITRHKRHTNMDSCSPPSTPSSHDRALPPPQTSATQNRRKGSASLTEHHQPIGFVCCHCRYHSSGSYCSNPDYAECPHKSLPRCRNCPIIFTPPRLRHDTGEQLHGDVTGLAGVKAETRDIGDEQLRATRSTA